MLLEEALKVVIRPYITEKTFEMIERENKLIFLVHDKSSRVQIKEAVETLYEVRVDAVNTVRTVNGKKAYVRLSKESSATELASKLGLV